jgi:endonuclease/exonuclease/phosphatase (EEP) superfamily protein YafD
MGALAVLTYLNIACLLLVLLVETVVAERRWWGTLLTYLPQQFFLVPSVLLLLIGLVRRRRLVMWGNLGALLIGLPVLVGVTIPWHFPPAGGVPVRVMTWNVSSMDWGADRVIAEIQRERPDVVCLQELRVTESPRFLSMIRRAFPGWSQARGGEVVILSRYPIIRQSIYPVAGMRRAMVAAVVEVGGKRLTVIAVHFSTTLDGAPSLAKPKGSRRAYLRQTAVARSMQTRMLLDIAAQAGTPVVIAGDFNTPARGIFYHRIAGAYPDAFRVAGWGTGNTFPAKFPLLNIDHLFTSRDIAVRRCATRRTRASDHLPVVADLLAK